jgi:hypothetical protein
MRFTKGFELIILNGVKVLTDLANNADFVYTAVEKPALARTRKEGLFLADEA